MINITLNLLAPNQREYLRYEHLYLYVRTVTVLLLTFTVVISGLLLAARLMLQDSYATALSATTTVNDRNRTIDREIAKLNLGLKDVKAIQAYFVKWSTLLVDLTTVVPSNVEVSYLNLEKKNHLFNLTGMAQQRDDFLALKQALEKLPYLQELSNPLTNLLLQRNVSFQFSAKLKPEALVLPPAQPATP